jgi:hypothetical protein
MAAEARRVRIWMPLVGGKPLGRAEQGTLAVPTRQTPGAQGVPAALGNGRLYAHTWPKSRPARGPDGSSYQSSIRSVRAATPARSPRGMPG